MRKTRDRTAPLLLATALAGSWRRHPAEPELTAGELGRITPLLVGSGAGALVWRRLRHTGLKTSSSAAELQRATRLHVLQAAIHEESVTAAFKAARARGVEPILLKGWAAARLYPETWLRPSGDIDLLVRPGQRATALAAVRAPGCGVHSQVDLKHDEFEGLSRREWDALYGRSRVVGLCGVPVRILSEEDQFRFLCRHLWRHGAYRPVWLCDVGAALEGAGTGFDWGACLGGRDSMTANYVACAIGLARLLLGADVYHLPDELRRCEPPRWLRAEVLRQWATPCTEEHRPRELMAVSLRHPTRALPAVLARWPDPITASAQVGARFEERRRVAAQWLCFWGRAAHFMRRWVARPGVTSPRPDRQCHRDYTGV